MLLTIAIPTFNRSIHLKRLLDGLQEILGSVSQPVEILISDNASSDGTDAVTAEFYAACPDAIVIRNATNIGADANIAQCFRRASGRYVWIIGDDDMPKRDALQRILEVLANEAPDILYAPSEWLPDVVSPDQGTSFDPTAYRSCDAQTFARQVNVWLTFLSGIIVKKEYALDRTDLDSFKDSCLIQMAWVLPALRHGRTFGIFRDALVLATAGNTGGYAVVKVFGANFSQVVAQEFGRGSAVYRAIIGRTVIGYLPQLLWNVRTGSGGKFEADMSWPILRREIGGFVGFWGLVLPVGRAPRPIARTALLAARAIAKLQRLRT